MKPRPSVWPLPGRRRRGRRDRRAGAHAFQSNLVFFVTPTQIAAHEAPNRTFRVGGWFSQEGSVAATA